MHEYIRTEIDTILDTPHLERPITYQGAVIRLTTDKSMLDRVKPFLAPLNSLAEKPFRHWKIRGGVEPVTLNIFDADGSQIFDGIGYDFRIEDFELFIATFGPDRVEVYRKQNE